LNNIYPIEQYVKQDVSVINVLLFVADRCNFSCPYCYNFFPRTNGLADLDLMFRFVEDMKRKTGRRLNISLIGGEPTLHPELRKFLERLGTPEDIQVEIITNFTFDLDYALWLLERNVKIAASWHGTKSDPANSKYISKMLALPMKYFERDLIEVRIMFERDNWNNSVKAYELLLPRYKKWIEISLLTDKSGQPYHYTQGQIDLYHKFTRELKYVRDFFTLRYSDGTEKQVSFNDMYLNPLVNFHLWKCNSGLDYVYVHADGKVYNCQSYYEHGRNPICSLKETNGEYVKELFKPCICSVDYCSCDFDVRKEKILKGVKK
jgi:sulfatase maturation enzyme AslB (radical SAM superfamily)